MTPESTKVDITKASAPQQDQDRQQEVGWTFANLREEMERLFDEFDISGWRWPAQQPALSRMRRVFAATPALDLVERDGEYELLAELPGMDAGDVEIRLGNGQLTIRGEKSTRVESDEDDYHLSERSHGKFLRSIPMPAGVDADKIVAEMSRGVLHLRMPKTEEARQQVRKIEVKAA